MFFDNMDDPRKQALLTMGLGLLSGRGGKGFGGFMRDVGGAGLLGMNAYGQAQAMNDRRSQEAQERELRAMQMAQMKAQQEAQARQQAQVQSWLQTQPPEVQQRFGVDPQGAVKQAFPDPVKPKMAFAPNGQAVDMNALQPGGNYAATPDWKNPEYRDWMMQKARAGASQVNVGAPTMEKEEHKQKAALNMKGFEEILNARRGAVKENSLIDAMMRNPVKTGKTAPITSTGKAWLESMGITGQRFNESVSNAQAFNAVAKEMVLNRQLLQKGPQTESDARRLEETVANLGNTPDANRAILAFSKAQNNRAISYAKFMENWWKNKGTLEGAEDAWHQSEGGKSLFDSPELKNFRGAKVIDFNSLPPGR